MAHRRGGFAKKIDTVHWTYGSFTFLAQSAGTAAATFLGAQHLPETLLRMRGEWVANFDGFAAPGISVSVTMGLILVPEGTGTTVLWSPITDGDAPWIWWDVLHLFYDEQVADVVASQVTNSGRRVIDSKAMRKIRNTELQAVLEVATIGASQDVNVAGSARVLAGS